MKIIVYVLLLICAAASFAHAEVNLNLKFTGIDIIVEGAENQDFAVERLWYDKLSDDDLVLYIRSNIQIKLQHNSDNLIGYERADTFPLEQQGDIYYKIDGDELRNATGGHKYASVPTSGGASSLANPLYRNVLWFKYADTGPFSLAPFKGKVNMDNGFQRGSNGYYRWGLTDEYGDEWHTLTFWDDDPLTNTNVDRRALSSGDGKIVQIVLDPQVPVISFEAPVSQEYYTTPPKTYYTPKIHKQKTYLTAGVRIKFANITNSDTVWYRVNEGQWRQYSGPITASSLFSFNDTVYRLEYRIGSTGIIKERQVHYNPAHPAANENHPKLAFDGWEDVNRTRSKITGGDAAMTNWYSRTLKSNFNQKPDIDFRCGIRSMNSNASISGSGYYYLSKTLGGVLANNAYVGLMENDVEKLKRVRDGLLVMYTVDPIGSEDGDGRMGAPCQERAMYSDGRCGNSTARAYDMIFHFRTDNGYPEGMTPIQHIKIRDNLANEASILLKFPGTWPENFLVSLNQDFGGTRAIQLEAATVGFAMAMPSYDTNYFGTSGADKVTRATHLYAPLVEMPIAWSDLHFKGEVINALNSSLGRRTAVNGTFDEDGWYIGGAREGYIDMMYQDLAPFLVLRHNFDGHHYERIEKHLRHQCVARYPFNGWRVPTTFYGSGYSERQTDVSYMVSPKFPDASLYKWSIERPVPYSRTLVMDSSVEAKAPDFKKLLGNNFAIFSSDFDSPKSVFFRVTMLNSSKVQESGTFIHCFEGHFNLTAYGERLAIENAGYGIIEYRYGTSAARKNVIIADGEADNNFRQFKGGVRHTLSSDPLEYVCLKTDHSIPGSDRSVFARKGINQSRHVYFVDRKFILMYDELTSSTGQHEYAWQLHGTTGGNTARHARDLVNKRATWTKSSGVSLIAQFISDVSLNQDLLTRDDYIDNTGPEPYIQAKKYGGNTSFFTVLYPLDAGMPVPQINRRNLQGYDQARIAEGESIYYTAVRSEPSDIEIVSGDTAGSADLFLLKRFEGVWDYISSINAKYLKDANYTYFESDKAVNVLMRRVDANEDNLIFVELENLTGSPATVHMISRDNISVVLAPYQKFVSSYSYAGGFEKIAGQDSGWIPDNWGLKCYNNLLKPKDGVPVQIVAEVKEPGKLKLAIYDSRGREVKVFADEYKNAGTYRYEWKGENDSGAIIGSGVYMLHMKSGGFSETKKIVVVK